MKSSIKEVQELQKYIPFMDQIDSSISEKDVGWHIDHSLKVIIKICEGLNASNPEEYKRQITLSRLYIFLRGSIPRGRGKAPEAVIPREVLNQIGLEKQLIKANKLLQQIELLPINSFIKHPYFGNLNVKNSLRSIEIHTRHHLKIIKDIIKRIK